MRLTLRVSSSGLNLLGLNTLLPREITAKVHYDMTFQSPDWISRYGTERPQILPLPFWPTKADTLSRGDGSGYAARDT